MHFRLSSNSAVILLFYIILAVAADDSLWRDLLSHVVLRLSLASL